MFEEVLQFTDYLSFLFMAKVYFKTQLIESYFFCPLFYTSFSLIFNNLQANVRIRDYFTLIMHLAPEEESGLLSLRKDIETPNKHTKRME